jgi:DNA gyrase/topoisomerase IV subunit A
MNVERPDLSQTDPAVRAYIQALEAELARLRPQDSSPPPALEPSEPPTTLNVITISAASVAKRTPRHLYTRQRRGGMGVFDLDTPKDDPPTFLTIADEDQKLLLLTSQARAFYLPVDKLPASPVRSRGQSLSASDVLPLRPQERLAHVVPDGEGTYLALLSQRGYVRLIGRPYLRPATPLYDTKTFGPLVAACWTGGQDELFVVTRQGRAIRFAERGLPVSGGRGLRLTGDDVAVAVAAVGPESGVFLCSANGLGTIRLMSGFNPNKAPGAGGKVAIKSAHVVGAVAVDEAEADDLFILSRLGKVVRFQAADVPGKEGVVQGVRCMALRNDETVAVARSLAQSSET